MDRSQAEALAAALPQQPPATAFAQGMRLLTGGYPEVLLPPAQALAKRFRTDPRMAQMLGLAARAAGEAALAHHAFREAAALAPHDPLIAHSLARTALEAGRPASALFAAAQRLAPGDGAVVQGLAAALAAEHRAPEGIALLAGVLQGNPLWIDGHRSLAHLAGQYGGGPLAAIDGALAAQPRSAELHRLKIATLLEARRSSAVPEAIAAAQRALGPQGWLDLFAAHAASERGDLATAGRLFAAMPAPRNAEDAGLFARHFIKAARPEAAMAQIEPWLGRPGDETLWGYAALAWRMAGDPRHDWLEGDGSLVGVYDLGDKIAALPGLASELRALHTARAAPLDQSVRGGTQTDGNLLLRDAPALAALRRLLLETVATHAAGLGPARPGHPTFIARRTPLRIAGSWSVRLTGAGFHADHVHPQGWFSSALYLALPETLGPGGEGADRHAGWLSLGECRELAPALPPIALIEPRPGRLVLFPSTMWHGTRPFPAGERLTVAFDIARPKQD